MIVLIISFVVKMDQKGFLSADLIFATLLLIVITAGVVSVVSTGIDTAQNTTFSKAKVLSDTLASTVNAIYTNGDGNYIIFNFTSDSTFNYKVYVNNNGVNVEYNNKNASSSIIPKNYLGNSYVINPGDVYNITNQGGIIVFNKIS